MPLDWLAQRLEAMLPLQNSDGATADETATVRARVIDRRDQNADLSWSSVKLAGSKLRHLLGGDWVQENATTSLAIDGKTSTFGSVPGHFATYFDSVDWASGATFSCNSDHAIERKARDVKATIARAVRQVPTDSPSILHIAFETLEGPGVEEKRMQKIIPSIEGMTSMSTHSDSNTLQKRRLTGQRCARYHHAACGTSCAGSWEIFLLSREKLEQFVIPGYVLCILEIL